MNSTDTNSPTPVLLTRDDVALLLSTSDRHVRRLIEDGRLPSVRLGGKVRIHTRQLDEFVERLCGPADLGLDVVDPADSTCGHDDTSAPIPVKDN
jgi:excisionase family DNA binding protein